MSGARAISLLRSFGVTGRYTVIWQTSLTRASPDLSRRERFFRPSRSVTRAMEPHLRFDRLTALSEIEG